MSPNPEIISQSREPEADRNTLKIIIQGILGIFLSVLTVYYFNQFLLTAELKYFLSSSFFGVLFFAIIILHAFLIKSSLKIDIILFLESVAPLGIFYYQLYPVLSIPLIVGSLIFFVLMSFSLHWGLRFLGNSLKIHFWLTAKVILPKVITGFLIFLSILLYLNYFEWGLFNDKLGKTLVGQLVGSSEPIIKYFFPEADLDQSVENFARAVARAQLKQASSNLFQNNLTDIEKDKFSKLSPEAKNLIVFEAASQLIASLEKSFGPIDAKTPTRNIFYDLIKTYFDKLSTTVKSALGLVVALLTFWTLKSIAVLFSWLIYSIAFLLFKICLVTGFAYINLEARSREFVLLR